MAKYLHPAGCGTLQHALRDLIIIIIIIFINCKWVVTRWQWLFYMYTECDIDIQNVTLMYRM
jgi:hypothetical protein